MGVLGVRSNLEVGVLGVGSNLEVGVLDAFTYDRLRNITLIQVDSMFI